MPRSIEELETRKVRLGKLGAIARRNHALAVQRKLAEQDHCCPGCDWATRITTSTGEVIGWECAVTCRKEMFV